MNISDQNSLIHSRISELSEHLAKEIPGFQDILASIHASLLKDPSLVGILAPSERATIIQGLSSHADLKLITTKTKTKRAPKKKAVQITAADL